MHQRYRQTGQDRQTAVQQHRAKRFWATVFKTVRPMLLDHRPVLSVCLSLTFVHFGQTVGRIKTKLGVQLGLCPGHVELDGDPAPHPQRGIVPPIFSPYLLQPNGCMDQDATWYGARPQPRRLCVRCGPRSTLPKKGAEPSPQIFSRCLLGQTAGWIKVVLGMEVGRSPDNFLY